MKCSYSIAAFLLLTLLAGCSSTHAIFFTPGQRQELHVKATAYCEGKTYSVHYEGAAGHYTRSLIECD